MKDLKFIPNTEKVAVENYPYGFTLKTTLYDTIEFNPSKGFRHTTQTINPKNGRLNKPKSSIYSDFMIRYYDKETGHIKTLQFSFNVGLEGFEKIAQYIDAVWSHLTDEEKTYCINTYKGFLNLSAKSAIGYGYANADVTVAEVKRQREYLNSFANIEEKLIKKEYKDVIVSYNMDSPIFADLVPMDIKAITVGTKAEKKETIS